MRFRFPFLLLLLFIPLAACASTGPGADCDPCASDELPLKALDKGGPAVGASGGQEAYNAPFVKETARLNPDTNIARGQGPATQSSEDSEHSEVASGGAQNAGVLVPTEGKAAGGTGGVPVAVQSAADTVASLRAALQLALSDPTTSPDKMEWIGRQLAEAQQALAAASAGSQIQQVTHNHFEHSRNTVTAVSTSKTGEQPSMDADAVKALAEGTVKVVEAGTAEYEDSPSTDLGVAPTGDSPPSPVVPE